MSEVIQALVEALGEEVVWTGDAVSRRGNGLLHTGDCRARAVVRPRSTEHVSTALRICNEHRQPVVPQGGLTGLVHAAVPNDTEVALSLELMNEVEEVDSLGRTMTVQAGASLQSVQDRADSEGLLFPLDLGARGSCAIGGNVSTNAGGNRVIRYGMTRDLVLGLEVVLADGTVVSSLNRMVKNNAGYDIKHLFIGTEGTLGVVTRVVLRLQRQPKSHCIALASLESFEQVTKLLAKIEDSLGSTMSAFEVLWSEFYELVTTPPAHNQPPLPHGSPFYVLVENLGTNPSQDPRQFAEVLGECIDEEIIEDAVIGTSRSERDRIWSMRDDVEQLGRVGPSFTFDVSLRIADMEHYVSRVKETLAARWDDPKCVVFGHLGDGNLHIVVGVGDGSREARREVEEIVYGNLRDIGGSVSAEHGIGIEKRSYLSWSRNDEEIGVMKNLKALFDPQGILNPGRVF